MPFSESPSTVRYGKRGVDVFPILFNQICESGLLSCRTLMLCSTVCQGWHEAIEDALPLCKHLGFRPYHTNVTGADVLRALRQMKGENLKMIDLRECRCISATDMNEILTCVGEWCPGVDEIDMTDCAADAVLFAVAVRAREMFAVASPIELYDRIKMLRGYITQQLQFRDDDDDDNNDRCPFQLLCMLLRDNFAPHLVLDPQFKLGEDKRFMRHSMCTNSWVTALLLCTSFPRMADHDATGLLANQLIHYAAQRGDEQTLSVLRHAHADLEARNVHRETPLLLACGAGNYPTTKWLLDHGADASATDRYGNTAFMKACKAGKFNVAALLLGHGADVSATDRDGNTPLLSAFMTTGNDFHKMLLDHGADFLTANHMGDTPLLVACASENVEMCERLLDEGADANALRLDGLTPALSALLSQNNDIIRLFRLRIEFTSRFNIDQFHLNSYQQSMAVAFLQLENIEALLCGGMSPLAMKGAIGALLLLPAVEPAIKKRLRNMRAFLDRNESLLKDPSQWPVKHTVRQLASQEPDRVFPAAVFIASGDSAMSGVNVPRLIDWINKPEVPHPCRMTIQATQSIASVAYLDSRRILALAHGNQVMLRNIDTGFINFTVAFDSPVTCVKFSPDGKIIAAGEDLGVVHFVDAQTGDKLQPPLSVPGSRLNIDFAPDGESIAVGFFAFANRDGVVEIFNTQTRIPMGTPLVGHPVHVTSVAYSRDGTKIASSGSHQTIRVWDARTRDLLLMFQGHSHDNPACTCQYHDDLSLAQVDPHCVVTGHEDWVQSLAFSPDSTKLASGSLDGHVMVWGVSTGDCLSKVAVDGTVNHVAFSPCGSKIAVAGYKSSMQDRDVDVVNILSMSVSSGSSGAFECQSTFTRHTQSDTHATQVEFIDADTVVSSSDDGTTCVWDMSTGTQTADFEGDTFVVTESSDNEHTVGQYVVTKTNDLILVHLTHAVTGTEAAENNNENHNENNNENHNENNHNENHNEKNNEVVAFFRAPGVVSTFTCTGDRIAVGCEDGEVLHLQAPWLVEEA